MDVSGWVRGVSVEGVPFVELLYSDSEKKGAGTHVLTLSPAVARIVGKEMIAAADAAEEGARKEAQERRN